MIRKKIRDLIDSILHEHFSLTEVPFYEVEKPRKENFGDYATNVALVLAGRLKKNPFEIAKSIANFLREDQDFEKIEVVKPGFINIWISLDYYKKRLKEILELDKNFGKLTIGKGKKVLVEFVSANPTGPLHIGHGRGAAFGDSLARLLAFAGYEVVKEYYINDRGTQMYILGNSVYLRAKELSGEKVDFPDDHYKGAYIYDIAREALKRYPDLLSREEQEAIAICKELALEIILADIKNDLKRFRVFFDNWYSERKLYERGVVEAVIKVLKEKGYIYEKEGALWFASSKFGDEKDRVLRRSNGEYTYFAGDIAYHYEKFVERDFDIGINIWGADHHGYVKRMKGALKALNIDPEKLQVILIQMVNLLEKGEKKSMSTRAGEFVELKELLNEVGVDPVRFIFLSRSPDSTIEFDVELAKKQTQENPVYYVQYAHARICSLFQKAEEKGIKFEPGKIQLKNFDFAQEMKLLKKLEEFEDVIEDSARTLSPHRIYYYLVDFASVFHEYYTKIRIIDENDKNSTLARLLVCKASQIVLKNGLSLLGVSAPQKM